MYSVCPIKQRRFVHGQLCPSAQCPALSINESFSAPIFIYLKIANVQKNTSEIAFKAPHSVAGTILQELHNSMFEMIVLSRAHFPEIFNALSLSNLALFN